MGHIVATQPTANNDVAAITNTDLLALLDKRCRNVLRLVELFVQIHGEIGHACLHYEVQAPLHRLLLGVHLQTSVAKLRTGKLHPLAVNNSRL